MVSEEYVICLDMFITLAPRGFDRRFGHQTEKCETEK